MSGDVAGIIGVFIPIVAIVGGLTLAAIIVVTVSRLRAKEKLALLDTAKAAVEKGQPLPPEVIEAMSARPDRRATAFSDLRAGVIWLAAGLGVALFGYAIGLEDGDPVYPLMGMGAVPVLIGIALIILSFFNPRKEPQE